MRRKNQVIIIIFAKCLVMRKPACTESLWSRRETRGKRRAQLASALPVVAANQVAAYL